MTPNTLETPGAQCIQAAARAAREHLPPGHALILIVAPYADQPTERQADYIATMDRESAISILKQVLFRWGINEEWMGKAK